LKTLFLEMLPITRPETTTSRLSMAFCALGTSLARTGAPPNAIRVDSRTLNSELRA
jgi:hypothetical protein